MELCSESGSALVNNNDVKSMHDDGDQEEKHHDKITKCLPFERKSIDEKRQSTTDEESDINCSIVQDEASTTQDSNLKIKFKLQKKEKKKSKNKNKSKLNCNNAVEKVGKLIIKDTHGAYSIKGSKKEYKSDLNTLDSSSMPKENEEHSEGNAKSSCDTQDESKNAIENEASSTTQVSHSSDLNIQFKDLDTKESLNHTNDKEDSTKTGNHANVLTPSQASVNSKTKRKSHIGISDDSGELLDTKNEKTDTQDCNEDITPRTKRRKISEIINVKADAELNSSNDHNKNNAALDIDYSLPRADLARNTDEVEPKRKKIKKDTEEDEKTKIERAPVEDTIIYKNDSCSDQIKIMNKDDTSSSKLSIEIPEEKTKNIGASRAELKNDQKETSPTSKSPNTKKMSIEDFLKELNEESKNIQEGDEIPDSDDHEMSNDTACVIVKNKTEQENTKNESNRKKDKEETNENVVTNSELMESENDMSHSKTCIDINHFTPSLNKSDNSTSVEVNQADLIKKKTDENIKLIQSDEEFIQQDKKKNREKKKELSDDEFSSEDERNLSDRSAENNKEKNEDINDRIPDESIVKHDLSDKEDESYKKEFQKTNAVKEVESNTTESKHQSISKAESSKVSKKPGDISNKSGNNSSDSSDASNSSDESSSSASESSDSDSSSDSESETDSSDSESTDTEKKKPPEQTIVHPKRLKIRNAPSLSQDSVHKSDSSSSTQDLAEKSQKQVDKTEDSLKPPIKVTETLSQQILAGSTGNTPAVVKKKRGRPRKNPLPDAVASPCEIVAIKNEPREEDPAPDDSVLSVVNTEEIVSTQEVIVSTEDVPKGPKKRGRKPGFKVEKRGRKPGRKKKIKKPRKKYYEEYKQQKALLKQEEKSILISTPPVPAPAPSNVAVVKRKRGRPKKIRDPEPSSSDLSEQYNPSDALSEQLLQLNSHLNQMVHDIPGISPGDDQNSNEITDNRLLEEINSGLDVITEEIVSEDVSNYLGHPLDEILQFQEPKREIKVEDDDYDNPNDNYDTYKPYVPPKKGRGRPSKHAKLAERRLKTEDPNYHKRYYKYVKIPKDQQKKRGPKKRDDAESKPEKRRYQSTGKGRGRPRKRDLGAVERREERHEDSDHPYDESLSKELESVNRSMENILTECGDDKDFTVAHLKFEQLSEDQLKRSNRPKKCEVGMFSDFDNQIDELIEMAANEVQDRPKPKYRYYERIPKHLQKKRGRPKKIEDPDAPPRPPKPKKEKPPKPKKTVMVKKMVTDPETGEEVEVEVEEVVEDDDNNYIDFDEEDEYDEDIDDEDKDKDFDIQDYLKKGKNNISENLEYEEVYPTKEKLFKPKKTLKNYRSLKAHHARFNRFGKFGNKIRSMMPVRRNINACDFRYVTVCDADFNPIAKVQRMYCIKVAPATYDVADRYKPRIKLKNLSEDDVSDFFDKYWCDLCEISFWETRINKRRHEYIYHTEEIECDLCDRTVSNRYNLKKHQEIFHTTKVYTCKVCDEEYKKFRSFQMHVWENHPDVRGTNRAYFCNICQTVFYRRASFKFHYHEHLNGNIFAQFDTSLSDIEFLLKQLMY